MTRTVLALVLLLGACSSPSASSLDDAGPPAAPGAAGMPAFAAVHADGTVSRVSGGEAVAAGRWADGTDLVALDGRTLVETAAGAGETRVAWVDLSTGDTLGRAVVPGVELEPVATDVSGRHVALVSGAGTDLAVAPREGRRPPGVIAPGRTSSTIVVAGRDVGVVYRTTLVGNFVPEAFGDVAGAGGAPATVYLLEYLPAEAPTHYRVRVLSTERGDLGLPFNLRDKTQQVDAAMAGVSRTQVVSGHADGLLFTLYRGVAGEDGRHGYAFVHTLGFGGGVWCLDVAPEMELDHEEGAIVVAGDRLVVASANGTIGGFDIGAVLDPEREPAMGTVRQYLRPDRGTPVLAATRDRVWVAWGELVYELEAATLEIIGAGRRRLPEPVTAMAVTADGELLVAHPGGVVTAESGATVDLAPDADDAGPRAGVVGLLVT